MSAKIDNSPGRQLFVSRFYVLGRSEYECLTQVEPLLRSSDPADWLVAAAAYTEVGADGEALALYDRLVSTAPQTGAFHAARRAVLERIGRMIEAQQARATAQSRIYVSGSCAFHRSIAPTAGQSAGRDGRNRSDRVALLRDSKRRIESVAGLFVCYYSGLRSG